MDDTRETRIREYERWVCEALVEGPDAPGPESGPQTQAGRDNLVPFPRAAEPAAPHGR